MSQMCSAGTYVAGLERNEMVTMERFHGGDRWNRTTEVIVCGGLSE